jgi:hypothetical protein
MALATRIRILTTPPGDAPLSVRMAWVGLDLPLDPRRIGRQLGLASGVLSSPRGWWQRIVGLVTGSYAVKTGYAVNALEAVNLLQAKDPVAAAWWREHCAHLLDGKRSFLFPAAGCEERP